MGAKTSAETKRALKLVTAGVAPYRAALRCGIYPATIYRALKKMREKAQNKSLNNQ